MTHRCVCPDARQDACPDARQDVRKPALTQDFYAGARPGIGARAVGLSLMLAWSVSWLPACSSDASSDDATPVDLGPPAPDLLLPDLEGLDMATSLSRGLILALQADLRGSWDGFTSTLELSTGGCPNLYTANPEENDLLSTYWSDSCYTDGGLRFEGELGWESSASIDYFSEDGLDYAEYGDRTLAGSASVEEFNARVYAFTGEGSDSFYRSVSPDAESWTYSSQIDGTIQGAFSFEESDLFTGGLRESLYLNYSRGSVDRLTVRGDVFLLDETIDRFDSVSMDFTLYGQVGAPPGTCVLEPFGFMGMRDTSAYWYEVIFLPIGGEDGSASSPDCDGCGTLFVRGVEQETPICLDMEAFWPLLTSPDRTDYVYSSRL